MKDYGLARITACSPEVKVGNPTFNAKQVADMVRATPGSQIYLFPELCLTGYTCADLFNQQSLLEKAEDSLLWLSEQTDPNAFVVVGLPVKHDSSLFNCAAVIHAGKVIGIVPKQHLPTYKEFYERRWFAPATGMETKTVKIGNAHVAFGIDLIFEDDNHPGIIIGIEICEDIWTVIPPSSYQALAGATILLNLSASNETVGKAPYRRDLVLNQSGRCVAAYAYASSGWTESTTDLVFGGHCMIAENGSMLGETEKFQRSAVVIADVCIEKLVLERERTSSFADNKRRQAVPFRIFRVALEHRGMPSTSGYPTPIRFINPHPFVPSNARELDERCKEIFGIQTRGLAKRIEAANINRMVIGVSGGLDSTLALLVAAKACDLVGRPHKMILGITMPGFGTTERTKNNAVNLMEHLEVEQKTIDIRMAALNTFCQMGHKPFGIELEPYYPYQGSAVEWLQNEITKLPPELHNDLVFENVQARLRTFFLMSHGFVVGTGDLSELALGWCTYNGDHMSMYNPNCSIPKTLVKFLVGYVAESEVRKFAGGDPGNMLYNTLVDITKTVISPELLPVAADGSIRQSTEQIVGPYELIDFFMFCMIRCGYGPKKTLYMAEHAKFNGEYNRDDLKKWLKTFYARFFSAQFKRSCVPDGPKVGSVSLSPRGDWRMPSDADASIWLNEVDEA